MSYRVIGQSSSLHLPLEPVISIVRAVRFDFESWQSHIVLTMHIAPEEDLTRWDILREAFERVDAEVDPHHSESFDERQSRPRYEVDFDARTELRNGQILLGTDGEQYRVRFERIERDE